MTSPDVKKILLLFPPHWDTPVPPLGTSYIAAYLRSKDFEVKQMDVNHTFRYDYHLSDDKLNQVVRKIVSENPDVLGVSLGHTNFQYAIRLLELIKKQIPDVFVVAGGPHVSYIGEKIIRDFPNLFDIGVFSEGEETVYEILQKKTKGEKLHKINGTIHRTNNGRIVKNPPRYPSLDLDDYPFPDFDDFLLQEYPLPILPLLTTRGCLHTCSFCGVHGNQITGSYRERSIENVINEMKRNVERYNCKIFLIGDALINSNPRRLTQLCDRIIHEDIDVYWLAEAFPNLTKKICEKMYKAGCRFLWISPETGSPVTAHMMKKDVDLAQAKTSIKNAKNAGIFISTWFIIGFPTETQNDLEKTITYAREQKEYMDECTFVPFHLMVGSPVYKNPQEYNIRTVEDNRYEMFSSFHKEKKTISKFKIMKYSEKLWDEFNPDARFNFEIEKRIFFERLGFGKRMLAKLLSRDYFDKKKKEYRYEDLFRKALQDLL
jgi:radical SAM superfamily enzyme YgiQ (UPF0313 family)